MLVREGNKIIIRKRSDEFLDFLKSDKGKIDSWWKEIKKKCKRIDAGDSAYYEIKPNDYKKVAELFFDCLKTSKKVNKDVKVRDYSPSLDRVIRKLEKDKENKDNYEDKDLSLSQWINSDFDVPYSGMFIKDNIDTRKEVSLLYNTYGEKSPDVLGVLEIK